MTDGALQECQDRLHALFEGVETGIFVIDPETHLLVDANSIAARMVGAPRERIVGSLCHKFVCPAEQGRCPVTDLGQTVDNSERVLLTAAGERRAIIKTVRPVEVSGRRLLLESFLDITELKKTENALKERTAYLNLLIEVSPLGILVLDEAERVVMSNAAFERLFFYTREEVRGKPWSELILPADLDSKMAGLARECLTHGSAQATTRRRRKNGSLVDVRIFGARLDIDGRPSGFLAHYEDITAQLRAEQSLRESEDRFRTAFEDAPYGMCMTTPDGRFMHANAALCVMLGYPAEELLAGMWQQLTHPGDMERSRQAGLDLHSGARAVVELEKRYIHKSGSIVWGRIKILPIRRSGGEISHFITQIEDITLRKKADEAQAFLASLVESSPDAIVGMNPDGTVVSWNQGARELSGYTAEEMIGRPVFSLVLPERMSEGRRILATVSRGERMNRYETVLLRKDGSRISVSLTFSPVLDSKGSVTGIATIGHDITERKRVQESLRESEEQFRTAFENAPYGMCMISSEGRFLHVNAALCSMLGYPADELLASAWDRFSHPDDVASSRRSVNELMRNGATVELENRYIHKSGRTVWARLKISPVRQAGGEVSHLIAQIEDITKRKQADEAQAFLATLVESSPDAIVGETLQGTVVSWNQGAQALYGYAAEEMIGKPIALLVPPEHAKELQDGLEAAGRKGLVIRYETVRVRKDGIHVDVALTISPVRDATGKVTGIATIAHDITERKFREQQTHLQTAALESAANGIVITGRDGKILWVNPAFSRLTGYAAEEVLDKNPRVLNSGVHDGAFYQGLWSSILRGDTWHGEIVNRRKDGTFYDEEMTITPVRSSDGGIHHFVAVKQDVTERKRRDAELRSKTALLEAQANSTIDGMLVVDSNGRRMLINKRLVEMYEIPEALLADPDQIHLRQYMISRFQDREAAYAMVDYLYSHPEEAGRRESELTDGTVLDVYSAPVKGPAGECYGRVWTYRDITDQKRAQEELLFKNTLLETEAETSIDGILVVDPGGRRLQTNARFVEIFNVPAEVLERGDDEAVLACVRSQIQNPEAFVERVQYLYAHESERARDEVHLRDGRCLDRYSAPLQGAGGKYYGRVWYFRDITDRKRAEQALRENEQRYRELFENASEVIFTTDLDGRFTSLNRVGEQLLGYSQDEAAQTDIWHLVVPEYWELIKQNRREMTEGATQLTSEIEVVAKGGCRVRLEVKPRLILRGGQPAGIQAIARDITGRDVAEMELRQAQKLESVGRLASGIAHEINTPIQFVGDNTHFLKDAFASLQLLLSKFEELRDAECAGAVRPELLRELKRAEEESDVAYLLDEVPRAITQTMEGVDRVATIVRAMKEFAHPESKEMAPADLNKALLSTVTVARNEWKYVADVQTEFAELPFVACNIGDVNQVFLNLLVNAAHAIGDVVKGGEKGRITIRTAREGGAVHISIADTGSGIPETIRTRIFDPFFTTKEVGRGTGQGLAIARSVIVDRHKGALTFESEVGKGTTFHIRLPISPDATATEMKCR